MKRYIDFCDICGASEIVHLATHSYRTSVGEQYVCCASCAEDVESTGLEVIPLDLPEFFLEDILNGLVVDRGN